MNTGIIKQLVILLACLIVVSPGSYAKEVSGLSDKQNKSLINGKTPRFDIRALHLTLRKTKGGPDSVKQTKEDVIAAIQRSSRLGFNVIILKVNMAIKLKNTANYSSQWAYSIDETKEIIRAARDKGMEIIPEINLLTHQKLLMLQIDRNLMLNDTDYDPNNPRVYGIIFPILDEIISIFRPEYIHIGHDEALNGIRKKSMIYSSGRPLMPDDFLFDTIRIYNYLKERNIRTMMWADMLLDPYIYGTQYHPAELNGYDGFSTLVDKLPKDIILCDWHYLSKGPEYPTYSDLQKKGFTVWGAVWKDPDTINAFSKYVAKYARKNEGMIATTWWPFVTQEKDVIERILELSSNAFFY